MGNRPETTKLDLIEFWQNWIKRKAFGNSKIETQKITWESWKFIESIWELSKLLKSKESNS